MLIQDFVYVDAPVADVRRRLAAGAEAWLTPLAARAGTSDNTVRVRIGPAGALPLLGLTTRVTIGTPAHRGDSTVIPMTWQEDGFDVAFPVLTADLEVAPIGDDETQLTLMGRYDPPLGVLGQRLDRILMHRLAQASVRHFLEGVGAALASPGAARTG